MVLFTVSRRTRPELNYTVCHPEYQHLEARLKTFDRWPRHLIQTPRQLAEAGLYYTGNFVTVTQKV